MKKTENLNILRFDSLPTPGQIKADLPETSTVADLVTQSRAVIQNILAGTDERCLVLAGPC